MNHADGAATAPVSLKVERQGGSTVPYTRKYPDVRAGVCEYCGVIDPNYPGHLQYKLCQHYRGLDLACSYCPEAKDQVDVVGHSWLNIHGHPDNPNQLVIVCNSFECTDKHIKRFKISK